jgi:hypothetical protein
MECPEGTFSFRESISFIAFTVKISVLYCLGLGKLTADDIEELFNEFRYIGWMMRKRKY